MAELGNLLLTETTTMDSTINDQDNVIAGPQLVTVTRT